MLSVNLPPYQVHSALFEKFIPDPFGLISYGEYIFFVRWPLVQCVIPSQAKGV